MQELAKYHPGEKSWQKALIEIEVCYRCVVSHVNASVIFVFFFILHERFTFASHQPYRYHQWWSKLFINFHCRLAPAVFGNREFILFIYWPEWCELLKMEGYVYKEWMMSCIDLWLTFLGSKHSPTWSWVVGYRSSVSCASIPYLGRNITCFKCVFCEHLSELHPIVWFLIISMSP